jgi:hypothetical protein
MTYTEAVSLMNERLVGQAGVAMEGFNRTCLGNFERAWIQGETLRFDFSIRSVACFVRGAGFFMVESGCARGFKLGKPFQDLLIGDKNINKILEDWEELGK